MFQKVPVPTLVIYHSYSFLAIRNLFFIPGTKNGSSKARERKLIFCADKRAFFFSSCIT